MCTTTSRRQGHLKLPREFPCQVLWTSVHAQVIGLFGRAGHLPGGALLVAFPRRQQMGHCDPGPEPGTLASGECPPLQLVCLWKPGWKEQPAPAMGGGSRGGEREGKMGRWWGPRHVFGRLWGNLSEPGTTSCSRDSVLPAIQEAEAGGLQDSA